MAARDLEELRYLATQGFAGQPASTWALLGTSFSRLEERKLALEVYRAGLEQHPDDFQLHYLLVSEVQPGVDQERTDEELRETERLLRAALAIEPRSSWARFSLAKLYQLLEQEQRALEHYERAIELRPDTPEYRYRMARSLVDLGRFDEAAVLFEQGLGTEDPEWVHGWSLSHLASLTAVAGDPGRALELTRHAWASKASDGFYVRTYLLVPFAVIAALGVDEAPLLEARELLVEEFGRAVVGADLPEVCERISEALLLLAEDCGQGWYHFESRRRGASCC